MYVGWGWGGIIIPQGRSGVKRARPYLIVLVNTNVRAAAPCVVRRLLDGRAGEGVEGKGKVTYQRVTSSAESALVVVVSRTYPGRRHQVFLSPLRRSPCRVILPEGGRASRGAVQLRRARRSSGTAWSGRKRSLGFPGSDGDARLATGRCEAAGRAGWRATRLGTRIVMMMVMSVGI